MSIMSLATDNSQTTLLSLEVSSPDGAVFQHELQPGHVLIVGSSAACGLRLDGHAVAGMHCSMEADEIGIKLRDWSSDGGTFVDGCRLDEEMHVQPGAEIQIADYRVTVKGVSVRRTSQLDAVAVSPAAEVVTPTAEHVPSAIDFSGSEPVAPETSIELLEEEVSLTDDAVALEQDSSASEWNRDFDPWDSTDENEPLDSVEQPSAAVSAYDRETFVDDTTEFLQEELEFLRAELAERDARLSALECLPTSDAPDQSAVDTISRDEAETLVGRLEQLLVELEEKDEQISTLSDLLRASEDAVEAADEEREQMETWIGEVERRVSHWQEEWHAERDRLTQSVDELTRERDRAEQHLVSGSDAGPSSTARDELLQQVREEYSRLKANFLELEEDRSQLQSQLAESRVTDNEQRVAAIVDETLREERLALAQEKAAIARATSEMSKQQEDIESQQQRGDVSADSADLRIRAFREHLREIHETEPRQVHTPSFSDRMGKLWRKLEGRPLDTD